MMKLLSRKQILYGLGAAVIAAILSIAIVAGVNSREGQTGVSETETRRLPVRDLNPDDLVIPKEYTEVWRQKWLPYREQKKVWTEEDVEPYWSDTKKVLLEVLEKQTVDTLMRNLSPSQPGMKKK